jgi:hypothetical protein
VIEPTQVDGELMKLMRQRVAADRVRAAADALNEAQKRARAEGLHVELLLEDYRIASMGEHPLRWQMVGVRVTAPV